jgi:SAM-dependent methyltransferase
MYIYYLDESEDDKYGKVIFSALGIPSDSWNDVFKIIKHFRLYLNKKYRIRMAAELHAREFVAGRGKPGSKIVTKYQRAFIFKRNIRLLSFLKKFNVECINVCLDNYDDALDRIINRINRSLKAKNDYGILVFDKGDELKIRRVLRKMRVFNLIPSKYGYWDPRLKNKTKNITIDRIIADPFFRDSQDDYFIQNVDFIAYALLRREFPTERILKYNLEKTFEVLKPILNINAHPSDEFGIVRK